MGEQAVATDDSKLARELAEEAGRRLLELRSADAGNDPRALGRAGDRLSQEFLSAELAARRPGDAVLSEEALDDKARLKADRVWIVDPLDGTREFGEGRSDWAVHVALWERSAPGAPGETGTAEGSGSGRLTAGAVALPAQEVVLSTATSLPPPQDVVTQPIRIVVSRSRPPAFVQEIGSKLGADIDPLGSAGAKAAAVILGEADAYVHAGGFYEWDTAAPVAVAQAAGFHVSRIDGSPVTYNEVNPKQPDILLCPPALAGVILQAIREVTNAI
jgi:3'(2'), 5'-bisphosphate nucleotidase